MVNHDVLQFDIFRTNGGIRWLEAASDLHSAKQRLKYIGASSPGTYLILDQPTGDKISFDVDAAGVLTIHLDSEQADE